MSLSLYRVVARAAGSCRPRPGASFRRVRPRPRCCAAHSSLGVLHRAFQVPSLKSPPPYDTVHVTVLYPQPETEEDEAAPRPAPVVVLLGAANVPASCYTWLGARLVDAGYVAVLPCGCFRYGTEGVTLALPYDVAALDLWEHYREGGPSAQGLAALLVELEELNEAPGSPLRGALDLQRVAVGGHATGGRAALETVCYSARTFPSVAACFSYGASLDNEPRRKALERPGREGVMRPFQPHAPPMLLLGGELDTSLGSLGTQGEGCTAGLRRVLSQGVDGLAGESEDDGEVGSGGTMGGAVLAVLRGASYGTPCFPLDIAAAASDADFAQALTEEPAEASARRDALSELLIHFMDAMVAPPGWLPEDEAGPQAEPSRIRETEGGPQAEGLGRAVFSSRAARALAWPPEPESYPLSELAFSWPSADALKTL